MFDLNTHPHTHLQTHITIYVDIFLGPPLNKCIATINGKKILKNMDETWMTEDVCVKAQCAFDTNGRPIIKTQREICDVVCKPVSEFLHFCGD